MKPRMFISLAGLFLIFGCSPSGTSKDKNVSTQDIIAKSTVESVESEVNSTQKFNPFIVYSNKGSRDNHFIPSGFMPDGVCLSFTDTWTENCRDSKTCIKIEYNVECSRDHQNWAGIYWLNPANNWGNKKGGFNLTGAEKLTFWARGEKGGEQIEEFTIGGVTGKFPDSDIAAIGPVILTQEWRQYEIDLRGKDLTYISGGFAWSTNTDANPETCTFYLDDIQYE